MDQKNQKAKVAHRQNQRVPEHKLNLGGNL